MHASLIDSHALNKLYARWCSTSDLCDAAHVMFARTYQLSNDINASPAHASSATSGFCAAKCGNKMGLTFNLRAANLSVRDIYIYTRDDQADKMRTSSRLRPPGVAIEAVVCDKWRYM